MRAEKNVASQLVEDRKATFVVFGNLRIGSVADQLVARVHIWAADNYDVEKLTAFRLIESPRRGSPRVAGSEMRGKHCAAEIDGVAVVEDAIDVRGRVVVRFLRAVLEVGPAAGLNNRYFSGHDVVFSAGEANDFRAARAMVVMGVADEKDFDIAEVEPEIFDALFDQRH